MNVRLYLVFAHGHNWCRQPCSTARACAAVTTAVPLTYKGGSNGLSIDGRTPQPGQSALHRQVSALCYAAGVEGVRADLVLLRAACAHAAWQQRDEIGAADVEAVAELVLAHRRKHPPQAPQASAQENPGSGAADDQPPANGGSDWGELPPQAVPTQRLAGARPLPAKKP